MGDTTGYSFNLSNTVAQNDQLDFVTNKLTTSACDNTVFMPMIVLTTGSGSGGTTYQDLRYVYTPDGNISDIYDNLVVAGAGDQHLSYDGLSRLTLANGPYGTSGANASLTYNYDEVDNLTFNTQMGTYTYPTSGASSVRPHAVTTVGSNTYSYDANGNLTSGAGRSLTYNLDNKPLTVTIGGQTTTFVYDGDGERVKKIVGTTTTRYVSKLYECDNASCSRMVFVDGQRIATIGASGAIYYYHPDHLGSSSVITESTDAKAQSLTYFPYGATRTNASAGTPPIDAPYKYTGQELDSSTGLYDYGARLYDGMISRFVTPDYLVAEPGNPRSLNRYSYVYNNPMSNTDPTGLCTEQQRGDSNFIGPCQPPDNAGNVPKPPVVIPPAPVVTITAKYEPLPPLPPPAPPSGYGWGSSVTNISSGLFPLIGIAKNIAGLILRYDPADLEPVSVPKVLFEVGTLGRGGLLKNVLGEAQRLGKAGEIALRITGKKQRIASLTNTAKYRIPDFVSTEVLQEVKNVKSLSLTNQIKDFHLYSKQEGLVFILDVRQSTRLSGPLQDLVNPVR